MLSPFGGRVHAPWAMAVRRTHPRRDAALDVETMWTDDGFVVRFPETDEPPDPTLLLPDPDEVEALVVRQLGGDRAVRRAVPRERRRARCCCRGAGPARARRSGSSASAPPTCSAVAARFGSFPMLLETYRECLRDVFDMPALVDTLRDVRRRARCAS